MPLVHAPHLGRAVKVGGRRNRVAAPRLHLRNYLRGALPPVPATFDFSPKARVALTNIYGNDQLGDCVIAGGYHAVATFTGNATGTPFIATMAQILADYSAIGGYVPGDPSTDQGCNEQTALDYWCQKGFANGTKLDAYLAVDATNPDELRAACFLFENLMFGVGLPDSWLSPFPSGDGYVWDAARENVNNGHCFIGYGANAKGIAIDSWGLMGTFTWAGMSALASRKNSQEGETWVLLSPDLLAKGQSKAPNGVDWNLLLADWNALGGNMPVPAPQPAPPAPGPSPAPAGVSLAQAQAWVKQGLSSAHAILTRGQALKAVDGALAQNWPASAASDSASASPSTT